MDHLDPERRSRLMSRIRGRDTKPELQVRRLIHALGYRYRLHTRDLPGRPDIVFRPRKKVIFVHGCFWHQHNCKRGTRPRDNRAFWTTKLNRNRTRDAEALRLLAELGWKAMIVWECQVGNEPKLRRRVVRFLK